MSLSGMEVAEEPAAVSDGVFSPGQFSRRGSAEYGAERAAVLVRDQRLAMGRRVSRFSHPADPVVIRGCENLLIEDDVESDIVLECGPHTGVIRSHSQIIIRGRFDGHVYADSIVIDAQGVLNGHVHGLDEGARSRITVLPGGLLDADVEIDELKVEANGLVSGCVTANAIICAGRMDCEYIRVSGFLRRQDYGTVSGKVVMSQKPETMT